MSRSKILLLALFFILILAFVYLFMDYFKGQRANRDLASQIDVTTQTLNLMPDPPAGINEQLKEAQAANALTRQAVSANGTDSTAIINSIFQAAAEFNLNADPFSADRWIERNVGISTYRILPFELTVKGNLFDYISFIKKLGDQRLFPNLVIESSSITHEGVAGQTLQEVPEAAQDITARLSVSVVLRLESGQ